MRTVCRQRLVVIAAACLAAWSVFFSAASPLAAAAFAVEDFENGVGGPGFDPAFSHAFYPVTPNPPFVSLTDTIGGAGTPPVPGDFELFLATGGDLVTFNIPANQYVDYASVVLSDYCGIGCTTVTFVGSGGSMTFGNLAVDDDEFFDTTGLGLGRISEVRLESFEGTFDNLTIRIVPEPGTLCLAATGGLLCLLGLSRRAKRAPAAAPE